MNNVSPNRRKSRGRIGRWLAAVTLIGIAGTGALCAQAVKHQPVSAITGNARVDRLLGEMTLDEKIAMVHGAQEPAAAYQGQAGYFPGVPRLGIPGMRFADGPPGILTRVPAMAPTST